MELSFERWNGFQTVAFDFGYGNEGKRTLKLAIENLGQQIATHCRKSSKSPFVERFENNLQTRTLGKDWDYHPMTSA